MGCLVSPSKGTLIADFTQDKINGKFSIYKNLYSITGRITNGKSPAMLSVKTNSPSLPNSRYILLTPAKLTSL